MPLRKGYKSLKLYVHRRAEHSLGVIPGLGVHQRPGGRTQRTSRLTGCAEPISPCACDFTAGPAEVGAVPVAQRGADSGAVLPEAAAGGDAAGRAEKETAPPYLCLHSVIVFDWDDTLFCTSFLSILLQGEWLRAGQWEKQRVQEVDEAAARTLASALELAAVCIVTNSVEGWVDHCVQTFMPLTLQILLEAKIPVVSARDGFEERFPGNPQRWKTEAFATLLADLDKEVIPFLCRRW